MSQILLVAVIGLLLLPSLTRRIRSSLAPAEWARINATSLIAAVGLFEVALVICASPLILFMLHGGPQKHFFPGGIVAGYISLVIAIVVPMSLAFGIGRLMTRRRTLRAEPWLGDHELVNGVDVVVLPTRAELAFSLPGSPPQILISEGLVEILSSQELHSVLEHEAAHIRFHHSRYLLVVAALAPLFGRVKPIRGSLDSLELAIECWADAEASVTDGDRRTTRNALMTLSHMHGGTGVAAFSKAQSAAIRIESLSDTPQTSMRGTRWILYTTLCVLAATPIVSLWMFAT